MCVFGLPHRRLLTLHFFFFNDTATTEIYTLSLHDALPIYVRHLDPGAQDFVFAPPRHRLDDDEDVAESAFERGRKINLRLGQLVWTPLHLDCLRREDRKSTRLNSSHDQISYAVFCLKKKLRQLAQETEALPPDEEVSWNLIALSFTFSLTLTIGGEVADLRERLLAMKQQAMQAGDHLATIRVMRWLARAYEQAGQLHQVHREALSALTLVEQSGGFTSMAGDLHYYLFNASYSWNRLEEASDSLRCLIHLGQDWQQVDLLILGEVCSAPPPLARGDLCTAQVALQKVET